MGVIAGTFVEKLVDKSVGITEWKPVVFGEWFGDRIKSIADRYQRKPPGIATPIGDVGTKLPEPETQASTKDLDRKNQ